jgi:hypothetical protein
MAELNAALKKVDCNAVVAAALADRAPAKRKPNLMEYTIRAFMHAAPKRVLLQMLPMQEEETRLQWRRLPGVWFLHLSRLRSGCMLQPQGHHLRRVVLRQDELHSAQFTCARVILVDRLRDGSCPMRLVSFGLFCRWLSRSETERRLIACMCV